MRNTRQGKAFGVCRETLLGGTRTEIHDRKGRVSSVESPDGWGKLVLAIARKPIAEWFKE